MRVLLSRPLRRVSPAFPRLLVLVPLLASGLAAALGTVNTCDEASLDAALPGGGAITFACDGTIIFTSTKTIAADTSLDATGRAVTLSGGMAVRLFNVNAGVSFSLTALTIANGRSQGVNGVAGGAGGQASAGGISTSGNLSATNCTFSGNMAIGGSGGTGTIGAGNGLPGGQAQGGAIVASGGSVSLTNCTLTSNSANGGAGGNGVFDSGGNPGLGGAGANATGGAIVVGSDASLTITGTNASLNSAHGGNGGKGRDASFGGPTANGGNGGSARGGVLSFASSGSATLTEVLVISNSSTGGSGGASGQSVFFTNGGATGGAASAGAFDLGTGTVQMSNAVFRASSATGGNGGSNLIADFGGNGGSGSGGALFLATSAAALVNGTAAGNNAAGGSGGPGSFGSGSGGVGSGGGAFVSNVSPSFTNAIFWGNSGTQIAASGVSAMPNASHCDVQGGWGGLGTANLLADPLFVSATNLRIQAASPCRDTGDNAAASGLTTDVAGDPRIYNSTVDIGAYEYAPLVLIGPSSQTLCSDGPVSFTVTVTSGQMPYGYQWRKDMVALTDGGSVSGSQTPILAIGTATSADNGSYDAVVTDGSTATETSSPATLAVGDATAPMVTAPAAESVTQTLCQ